MIRKHQELGVTKHSRGEDLFSFFVANQHRISSLSEWRFVLEMADLPDELAILCKALDSFDHEELPTYLYAAWEACLCKYGNPCSGFHRQSSPRVSVADIFRLMSKYGPFSSTILHPESSLSTYLALYSQPDPASVLFYEHLDQFEFAETFRDWLSIVESCGLDPQTYLEYLMPRFADCMEDGDLIGNGDNARLQQFIHVRYDVTYGSVMGPGWTWWVDPDSPAGLVLQEFQCFDLAIVSWKNISSWNGRLNEFAPRDTDGVIWPTNLDLWEHLTYEHGDSHTNKVREARQLREARFARRQAKKDRKAGRTSKVCKMPGSWVD